MFNLLIRGGPAVERNNKNKAARQLQDVLCIVPTPPVTNSPPVVNSACMSNNDLQSQWRTHVGHPFGPGELQALQHTRSRCSVRVGAETFQFR